MNEFDHAATAFKNVCKSMNLFSFRQSEIIFLIYFRIPLKNIPSILHISAENMQTQLNRIKHKIENNPDKYVFFNPLYKGGEERRACAPRGGLDSDLNAGDTEIQDIIDEDTNRITNQQIAAHSNGIDVKRKK